MSPARLSIEDMSSASDFSFEGLWSTQPSKKQKMQPFNENLDIFDDIETLWESKWKSACKRRQAPFQDASYLDFAPLFASLIQRGITSARSPLYTEAFLAAASAIADTATTSTARTDPALAAQRLLHACALLRVARFPHEQQQHQQQPYPCPLKQRAYALQKTLHMRATRLWDTDSPLEEVLIPYIDASTTTVQQQHPMIQQARGRPLFSPPPQQIPALVRVPLDTLLTGRACPAAVVVSSDRMACTETCERLLARGWAAVVVERPGTGECPVVGTTTTTTTTAGIEREREAALWKSVLGWMAAMGFYDMENVVVVGEGEAVLRMADTVGDRLRGVVAYLDREVLVGGDDDNDNDSDNKDENGDEEVEEELAMFGAQPQCPSLVVRERSGWATSNGLWTPVKEEEMQQQQQQQQQHHHHHHHHNDHDEGYLDLYAFGAQQTACVSQLHTTAGWAQVYAWIGDLMAGRSGGYFWTVIPTPEKLRTGPAVEAEMTMMLKAGWRFERELTPPSP